MGEKNFLDIEYVSKKEEDTRYKELIEILGRKDFTFVGGRENKNHIINTFILSEEDKTFLSKKQEKAVKEVLGTDLRAITCYQILDHKFYNYKTPNPLDYKISDGKIVSRRKT